MTDNGARGPEGSPCEDDRQPDDARPINHRDRNEPGGARPQGDGAPLAAFPRPGPIFSRLWPLVLIFLFSVAVLVLSVAEGPPSARPEASAATEVGGEVETPDGRAGAAGGLAEEVAWLGHVVIAAGGVAVLVSLLRRRVRQWLLPPPRKAPRATWGPEQLFYGFVLALCFWTLTAHVSYAIFRASELWLNLFGMAAWSAVSAAVVALVVTRPTVVPIRLDEGGAPRPDDSVRARVASLGLSLDRAGANSLRGAVGILGAFPLAYAAAVVGALLSELAGSPPTVHPVIERIAAAGAVETAILIVAACVATPMFEELFFRGFLYPVLRDRLGLAAAAVASSFVFAAVHPGLPEKAATFVLGLALCLLYERGGTLVAPVVAHAVFNTIQVALVLLVRAL